MPPKGAKLGPPPVPEADPDTPSALQQAEYTQGLSEFELPKTTLAKLAKGSVGITYRYLAMAHFADTG